MYNACILVKNFFRRLLRLKRRYFVAIFLVVAIFGFFALRSSKSEPLQFAQVGRVDIQETVGASGAITGRDSVSLKFLGSGRLSYIGVKVGDSVSRGVVVAGLDARDLSFALQQAENSLRSAQASAEKALDDVKGHSGDETFTQKETRTKAEVVRDSAYDAVIRARIALSQASMTTPVGGIVTQVNGLSGQFISAADIVVSVVDFSEVYFDAEVDEADIAKVAVGQKAEVSLNSYPDRSFPGTVDKIVPQTTTTSSGSTVVDVRIKLDDSSGISKVDGLNGQAEIVVKESKNVLSISREWLREDNKVLIQDGKVIKLVDVSLGVESDASLEVLGGLQENQTVVTNPSAYREPRKGAFSFFRR